MEAEFTDDMRIEISSQPATATECASACFQHDTCDSFQYDDYNHECVLFKGAYPNPGKHNSYMTSGWCPKGDKTNTRHFQICAGQKSYEVATTEEVGRAVQLFPQPSSYPLQCSAETGHICQFPFGLKGETEVRWSCVGEKGEAKCSPGSNDATSSWTTDNKLRFFNSPSNFHKCIDCNLSGIELPCNIHGVVFLGFPLATLEGNQFGMIS